MFNIHSQCAETLLKIHNPNLYLHTEISVGPTAIHLFCII